MEEFREACGPSDPEIARALYPDSIRALLGVHQVGAELIRVRILDPMHPCCRYGSLTHSLTQPTSLHIYVHTVCSCDSRRGKKVTSSCRDKTGGACHSRRRGRWGGGYVTPGLTLREEGTWRNRTSTVCRWRNNSIINTSLIVNVRGIQI